MNFIACGRGFAAATKSTHIQRRFYSGLEQHLSRHTGTFDLSEKNSSFQNDWGIRMYSSKRPGFISQFIDNIKQEMQKNKEMKESLKKFKEEAEKLEHSDALKTARQKFHTVESEANRGSEVFKERMESIKGKVHEVLEEASKSELGKKAGQIGEELSKSAKGAAETISEKSQRISRTDAFQTISQTAEAVKNELDQQGIYGRVYVPPKQLRKRQDVVENDNRTVEANTDAMGVELHKDSKFYQSWQNFKDNNAYVNKVLDWKIKFEESENPVIRASRVLTDKVTDIVSGLLQKTELSETLTEICKLDPSFDKAKFLKDCENDIIPNILEAMIRGDTEVLKDWCHEAPYNILSQPLLQAKKLGYYMDGKILDIDSVDLLMGKVMDQGPVLIINFQTQQILCVRDSKNNVVEGDPEKIMRITHTWVLSRDPTELNPRAAWRLLELSFHGSEQFV